MKLTLLTALIASPLTLTAATISVNFTDNGSADSTMGAADVAGTSAVTGARVDNWNNVLASGASQPAAALSTDSAGNSIATTVAYTTDLGNWRLGHAVANGDDRMWKGYLDAQAASAVTVANIPYASYDVVVYFDGSNGTAWRVANFEINGVTDGGEDSESADWGVVGQENEGKLYQLPVAGGTGNQIWPVSPNNDEGNYVVLSGLSGSSFVLNATGGASANVLRAPINGFQIIDTSPVPEPSSALLLALATLGFARRRR